MMDHSRVGGWPARSGHFSSRRPALFVLSSCVWIVVISANAREAVAQDAATLSMDIARRAWAAYHPLGRENVAEATLIGMQQEGSISKAVVRVRGRAQARKKYLSLDRGPRVAEVYVSLLFQPNRTRVLDLYYHEDIRAVSVNKDRVPQIVAEYNVELDRVFFIPGVVPLGSSNANSFPNGGRGSGWQQLGARFGFGALSDTHDSAPGDRMKQDKAWRTRRHQGERSDACDLETTEFPETDGARCADTCASPGLRYSPNLGMDTFMR